jgi:hypothetical protein
VITVILTTLGVLLGVTWAANLLILSCSISFLYCIVLFILVCIGSVNTDEKKLEVITNTDIIANNKTSQILNFISKLITLFLVASLTIYGWWILVSIVVFNWFFQEMIVNVIKLMVNNFKKDLNYVE